MTEQAPESRQGDFLTVDDNTQGLSEALVWSKVPTEPASWSTTKVFGLPLARVTQAETLDIIDRFIVERHPRLVITANLNFAMLSQMNPILRWLNRKADLVVADGMPLVWASKLKGRSKALPERVTGADLVPALCGRAAEMGHRVYFLGAAEGVAEEASNRLKEKFPELEVVGFEAPYFARMAPEERTAVVDRVREAKVDLLFVALNQPRGEMWLAENLDRLGVPVCIQIGASLDFIAGRVKRAPVWVQRIGMEWLWRLLSEPGRLFSRYASNAWFLIRKSMGRESK